jgi:hypothetical protein
MKNRLKIGPKINETFSYFEVCSLSQSAGAPKGFEFWSYQYHIGDPNLVADIEEREHLFSNSCLLPMWGP